MLFLMVAAECRARRHLGPVFLFHGGEQRDHRIVHLRAIAEDFLHRRTRQQPAARARERDADLIIIRVEQMLELRVKRAVTGDKGFEQEGLEEPARVCEVPLGRARIGHGLQAVIVRRERPAERLAHAPHGGVARRQTVP